MKRKNLLKILVSFLCCFPFLQLQAQDEDVMFQAFDWNVQNQPAGQTWYDVVSSVRNTISNAGIDLIWMPPPSNSAAPQGYLPREINNFDSAYGTTNQLKSLIDQYHNLDIKVISDIVVNHRVGTNDAVTFTNPAWPTFYITADDEGRNFVNGPVEFSINNDFVPGFDLKADGSSGGFAAARDLDHRNPAVRAEIIKWMKKLQDDLGFDGWRYDFVHGYDPIYNKEYNDATNPYFAVGELLESSRVQTNNFVNRTQGSSSAFDFNTKVSLQNAIRDNNLSYLRDGQGRPSGMMGINPSKSVTFLDNHDTGFAQQCCGSNFVFPGGETNLRKGYAYILTHPGNPMVFWTHFFDTGAGVQNAIKDLIAARKSVRIHSGSTISIDEARGDLYAAYIDGRSGTLAMKLGSGNWSPNGSGWTLQTSGTDYAVWTQGANTGGGETVPPYTVNFFKPSGWGSNINAYVFDSGANATLPGTSDWPGNNMTNISGTDWYSFTITPPAGVSAANLRVIFNDGNNQTDDLSRSTNGWYRGNSWSDNCPSDCSGSGSGTTNDVTLNFQKPGGGWGTNTNMYLYNKSTNQTLSGTAGWPGTIMNNLSGTSWCRKTFTLPNGVATNDVGVVFNNGNGQQTVDLTRGTDGWFIVTGSSNGKRTGTWSNNCTNNCPSNRAMELADTADKENTSIIEKSIVTLWPNPIKDRGTLSVNTSENGVLKVSISNILGQTKTIYSQNTQVGNQTIEINSSDMRESGIYFGTITLNGKKLKRIKIVKQ
ncbi:T9SS C-terminal target domain-containing protein [Aquimarina sp. AD1]|uniref:starch-binding protein n=1 Tax=Aquimarina sp. (strain AD1) TaxID=1714848 RepID=UPI000E472F9F|nr:starch-binding protein [Aquimarina sp. AD1]AXT54333.1 T9SS C-terminal target domain-containing protein [Aquimarina sp. AD1]RKN03262.1 starch-binding protein [Aquimarina sp. AD1]